MQVKSVTVEETPFGILQFNRKLVVWNYKPSALHETDYFPKDLIGAHLSDLIPEALLVGPLFQHEALAYVEYMTRLTVPDPATEGVHISFYFTPNFSSGGDLQIGTMVSDLPHPTLTNTHNPYMEERVVTTESGSHLRRMGAQDVSNLSAVQDRYAIWKGQHETVDAGARPATPAIPRTLDGLAELCRNLEANKALI